MLDRLPERLRQSAAATERATQMMADAKSARNQAAGDGDACYLGIKKEDTAEWQAADKIERLEREVGRLRTAFRVNMLRFGGTDAEINAVLRNCNYPARC